MPDRPDPRPPDARLPDPRLPDPDRKPSRAEMRMGGIVATAVLVFLVLFTLAFVWMAG